MKSGEPAASPPRTVNMAVSDAYDRWASSYDSYDNPMVFMARAALRAVLGDVVGQTVVEFGCGTGRNLALLKHHGAGRLIGLDFSRGMLAEAGVLDVGAELHLHDMMQTAPIAKGLADHALFCLSLEHVPDIVPPVGNAIRLLRHGGRITIVEIHPFLSLGGAKAHFRDGDDEVHMPTFAHQFPAYLAACREVGAVLADCREWRPMDIAGDLPPKVLKRGHDMPIVVTFDLRKP
jgi:ubiquinone/menaquinone biosynthesis C-methylase UbiE